MSGDERLAIEVDVGVEIETGGEEVFEGFQEVLLEAAVNFRDDGMEVGDEDVDVILVAMGVGEADHGQEGAEKVSKRHFAVDAQAGEDGRLGMGLG